VFRISQWILSILFISFLLTASKLNAKQPYSFFGTYSRRINMQECQYKVLNQEFTLLIHIFGYLRRSFFGAAYEYMNRLDCRVAWLLDRKYYQTRRRRPGCPRFCWMNKCLELVIPTAPIRTAAYRSRRVRSNTDIKGIHTPQNMIDLYQL
jgi:hypothetical protein